MAGLGAHAGRPGPTKLAPDPAAAALRALTAGTSSGVATQGAGSVYSTAASGHATGGNPGGGGGGGAAGAGSTGPSVVNIQSEVDPMEKDANDAWKKYGDELAAGTNEETTRELQRARDEISVGMEKEGSAAAGRGAGGGFFKTRALESGKRDLHALQGNLADVSLGRRAEALSGRTASAGQAASGRRELQFATQSMGLAEQRYQLDAAEAQRRAQEAPQDRLLRTIETASRIGLLGGAGGIFG